MAHPIPINNTVHVLCYVLKLREKLRFQSWNATKQITPEIPIVLAPVSKPMLEELIARSWRNRSKPRRSEWSRICKRGGR